MDGPPTEQMTSSRLDPLVGRVLDGRFRLVSPIAAGGMGRIYLAEQQPLGRQVAVKVLASVDDAARSSFRERFFREARLCSQLTHPHTVRVYDYGQTDDDVLYIAMEYIRGLTLKQMLQRWGFFEPARAVRLATQLCGSLAEAHEQGVVHRDLKPSNLMLTRQSDGSEFLRVLDFGIAKPSRSADVDTQSGTIFGSPGYMAPEQILGRSVTPRADIYAVGALLFLMLTGRRPFEASAGDARTLLSAHLNERLPSFDEVAPRRRVPRSLEWVTRRCLRKPAMHRFASVAELATALLACQLELEGGVTGPVVMQLDGQGQLRVEPTVAKALRPLQLAKQVPMVVRAAQPPRSSGQLAPLVLVLSLIPVLWTGLGLTLFVGLAGLAWWASPPAASVPMVTAPAGPPVIPLPAPRCHPCTRRRNRSRSFRPPQRRRAPRPVIERPPLHAPPRLGPSTIGIPVAAT